MDNEKKPLQKLQYRFDILSKRFEEECKEKQDLINEKEDLQDKITKLKGDVAD